MALKQSTWRSEHDGNHLMNYIRSRKIERPKSIVKGDPEASQNVWMFNIFSNYILPLDSGDVCVYIWVCVVGTAQWHSDTALNRFLNSHFHCSLYSILIPYVLFLLQFQWTVNLTQREWERKSVIKREGEKEWEKTVRSHALCVAIYR